MLALAPCAAAGVGLGGRRPPEPPLPLASLCASGRCPASPRVSLGLPVGRWPARLPAARFEPSSRRPELAARALPLEGSPWAARPARRGLPVTATGGRPAGSSPGSIVVEISCGWLLLSPLMSRRLEALEPRTTFLGRLARSALRESDDGSCPDLLDALAAARVSRGFSPPAVRAPTPAPDPVADRTGGLSGGTRASLT